MILSGLITAPLLVTLAAASSGATPAPTQDASTKVPDPKSAGAQGTPSPTSKSGPSAVVEADVHLVLDLNGHLLPDRKLPSGQDFSVGIADPTLVRGTLTVELSKPGCAAGAPVLWEVVGLRPVAGGLVGTLGALPSGREVSLRMEAQRSVPAAVWKGWSGGETAFLTREIDLRAGALASVAAGATCTTQDIVTIVHARLSAAPPTGFAVDSSALTGELSAVLPALAGHCQALVEAYQEAHALAQQQKPGPTPVGKADAKYLPAVQIAGQYVRLDQALIRATAEERKLIASQLQSLATQPGLDKAVSNWVGALRSDPPKDKLPVLLPAVPVVQTATGAYVPWSALDTDFTGVDPKTLPSQALAVFPLGDPLRDPVRAHASQVAAYMVRPGAATDATSDVVHARHEIEALIETAYAHGESEAGQHLFRDGTGTTAQPADPKASGSFFTPTFGVGPALAFGGSTPDLWAVPFIGATLYFAPIDRALTLRQLDGMPFRKVGVTVGFTLYGPAMDVPNRDEEPLLADTTLLVGVSARLSRLTNATLFGLPYKVAPENPLEEPYRLSGAVGLAFGFEADVWSAVNGVLKK